MTWAIKGESSYKDSVSLLTTSLPISLVTALFSVMTSTTSVSCCAGQPTHRPAAAVLDHAIADAAKLLSVPRNEHGYTRGISGLTHTHTRTGSVPAMRVSGYYRTGTQG